MSDRKISELMSGSPAQATDELPIARAGSPFKLDVSDIKSPIDLQFPEIQDDVFNIASSQILNLFSSPVVLLPAIAGTIRTPVNGHVYREPGLAYTIAGTDVGIYGNVGTQPWFTAMKGLLTVIGPGINIGFGVGNSASGAFTSLSVSSVPTSSDGKVGSSVDLRTFTSDPTGGTGGLVITLYWRDWTIAPL